MRENFVAAPALAAQMVAHVLDHAEHRYFDLVEHRDPAPDVEQRDLLRRRHDHAAVERHALRNGQLGVAGSRRQIDHQAIEAAPLDVVQELGFELRHHRAAPDHRGLIVDEKRHRNVANAVAFERHDPPILGHRDLPLRAYHHRDARPVNVGVHQPDPPAQRVHRDREINRDGRFADAALAARHRNDMAHTGNRTLLPCARDLRRRRSLDFDLDRGCSGHRRDGLFNFGRDRSDDLRLGRRRGKNNGDACVGDLDVLNHTEGHDVAAETRVLDLLEFGENFLGSWHSLF